MYSPPSVQTSFNYTAYDASPSLFVGASIYDVSSGTPVFLSLQPMTYVAGGVYVGSLTPVAGVFYLVIMAAYSDGTYTTPDTSRAPNAINIDCPLNDTSLINFNYATFDQYNGITVSATVYDITDSTSASASMAYVALGVYFGQYQGAINKTYTILKSPSGYNYSPGAESFQCYEVGGTKIYLSSATLVGQSVGAVLLEAQ